MPAIFSILLVLLSLLVSIQAKAASWKLSPSLELSETYTDNIALQSAGEEESDFVTQLNPAFSLTGEGRRLDLSLYYRLQNLFYANFNDFNTSNHQMVGQLGSELVKNMLFFDGGASYKQVLIDPEGDIGQGNISIRGDQQNIATTSLSPYIKRRLGGWSLAELRYSRETVRYIDGQQNDSISNAISGQLADAKPLDRWSWSIGFSSRKVKYVTGVRPGETWQYIDSTLAYHLSRKIDINGAVGYENNEYQRGIGVAVPKGGYWSVGFAWRPTPRTDVILSRGERYFGPVWKLDLTHRGRRSLVNGGYFHDLSSRQQALLEVPLFDSEGNPIIDPTTSEQVIGRIPVNEVYLRQRAYLRLEYRTLKAEASFDVYRELRDYQDSGREEDVNGASLAWIWRFSRKMSLTVNTRVAFLDVIDEYSDDLAASRITLERRLGRILNASVDARRTKRVRTNANNYTENLLTAQVTLRW